MSKPVAHYSPSYRAGDWLVVSGQLGLLDGALVLGSAADQARQALVNLRSVVEAGGGQMTDVAKCMILMTDIGDFSSINDVYAEAFGDHLPARSAFAVAALPLGALVEIEAWVYLGD